MLCHVQFSNTLLDVPASKVFHVRAAFDVEKGGFRRPSLACASSSCVSSCPLSALMPSSGIRRVILDSLSQHFLFKPFTLCTRLCNTFLSCTLFCDVLFRWALSSLRAWLLSHSAPPPSKQRSLNVCSTEG